MECPSLSLPDWSPTGSDGVLSELNFATVWNQTQAPAIFSERELVQMASATAATLAGLTSQLGSLAPGYAADLVVFRSPARSADPYATVTHATPEDLQLVLIGGEALYGDPALMRQITTRPIEALQVCGVAKALAIPGAPFAGTMAILDTALRHEGRRLAPLSECGQ